MFFMVGKISLVWWEQIDPDLSRRGQYLQPLLLQKGKPLNLLVVPLGLLSGRLSKFPGLTKDPEIEGFTVAPGWEGFTVTPGEVLKKSVMLLCLREAPGGSVASLFTWEVEGATDGGE